MRSSVRYAHLPRNALVHQIAMKPDGWNSVTFAKLGNQQRTEEHFPQYSAFLRKKKNMLPAHCGLCAFNAK